MSEIKRNNETKMNHKYNHQITGWFAAAMSLYWWIAQTHKWALRVYRPPQTIQTLCLSLKDSGGVHWSMATTSKLLYIRLPTLYYRLTGKLTSSKLQRTRWGDQRWKDMTWTLTMKVNGDAVPTKTYQIGKQKNLYSYQTPRPNINPALRHISNIPHT